MIAGPGLAIYQVAGKGLASSDPGTPKGAAG